MIRVLWAMIATEARMQARQRLSAALILVLPLITMPGALLGGEIYLGTLEQAAGEPRTPAALPLPVVVEGSDEVAGWIADSPGLAVRPEGDVALSGPLRADDVHAVARVEGRHITVRYRSDVARSRAAVERVQDAVKQGVERRRAEKLTAIGVPGRPEDVYAVETVNHAHGDAGRLGAVLPLLIQFTLVMVALYTGLDVISGEKERKTGETLLTTAVPRGAITAAKGLVTAGSAALSGLVGVGSVVLLAGMGALDLPRVLGASADALFTPGALAAIVAATLLLALQTSGVALVLAAWVPDYRTGSMLSAPLAVLLLIPAAVALAPSVAGGPLTWVLPIANLAIACRDLLAGDLPAHGAALVLASSAVHATLSVAIGAWLLGRETSLVGAGEAAARRALGDTRQEAFLLFVTCVVLLWFFGQLAQKSDLVWGMVFTQVALMAAPALGALAWLGLPIGPTLQLRRPRADHLALGIVAGLSMFGVAQLVWHLEDPFLPTSEATLESFRGLELADRPLWVPLLVFAVLPAVCEEILFRGALLGLLARTVPVAARVLVVALAFGAMHLLLPRILPTAALGVLLGFAAVRSGSLWVPIAMHVANNGLLVILGRHGGFDAALTSPAVLVATSAVAISAVAAMRPTARSGARSP